jgi:hypothetical protein
LHRLVDTPIPDWVVLGESVLIRPYNSSGVVAYIGGTDFSGGTWVGVELDAPTGEHMHIYTLFCDCKDLFGNRIGFQVCMLMRFF